MQVNVRKFGLANNLELIMIFEQQINLVLIRKLWIRVNLDRKIIKKYNIY